MNLDYYSGIVHKRISDAFKEFQTKNRAKNLAPETINFYKERYQYFIDYISTLGHSEHESCSIITEDLIISYINDLFEKGIKPSTIDNKVRGLKAFLNHCKKRGYTRYFEVPKIRYEKEFKEIYNDNELLALIEPPNFDDVSFVDLRNWVITMLLVNLCPRSKTIRLMKIKQIEFKNKRIRLQKLKSKKPYYVIMSEPLESVLSLYLSVRGGTPDDYLFPQKNMKEPLNASGFRSAMLRYNISRGVYKTSPHLYRHTVGETWVNEKGDIYELCKLLGHSSVKVTESFYTGSTTTTDPTEYNKHNLYNHIVGRGKQ